MLDVQSIAYDLCKSVTLDATMLKYKASVLAACMLFLGFQLQFELNMKDPTKGYELGTSAGRRKVSEVCDVFRLYYRILEVALEVPEVPKIVDFCDVLFERQISLHEEYKDQFKNIYRDRVRSYFVRAPKRVVSSLGGPGHEREAHISRTEASPSRK